MATTPTSPWGARRREILASAARTATGNMTGTLTGIERYTSAIVELDVTANSGTSQTLDVYVQTLLPDATTWQDLIHFAQFTTSNATHVASIVSGGDSIGVANESDLSVATIKDFVLGDTWRVRFVIAGTSPSFTFAVHMSFYP